MKLVFYLTKRRDLKSLKNSFSTHYGEIENSLLSLLLRRKSPKKSELVRLATNTLFPYTVSQYIGNPLVGLDFSEIIPKLSYETIEENRLKVKNGIGFGKRLTPDEVNSGLKKFYDKLGRRQFQDRDALSEFINEFFLG